MKTWEAFDYVSSQIKTGKIKFDLRNHTSRNIKKECRISGIEFDSFTEEELSIISLGGKIEPKKLSFKYFNCQHCGEDIEFIFDGEIITTEATCQFPKGVKEVTIELNIPSGVMVFANDLRKWFPVQFDYNVNRDAGILKTILAYEKVGMAHGFVGNTCPGVYQINNQRLSISAGCCDIGEETWDDEQQDYVPMTENKAVEITPAGNRVGSICTDLWWYSVVDYEDFKRRFLDMGGSLKNFKRYIKNKCDVVGVQPGLYHFLHFFNVDDDWETHKTRRVPNHYALISWAGVSREEDLYAKYKSINYTIGQCWLATVTTWPSLFGFKDEDFPRSLSMKEKASKIQTFPIEQIEKSVAHFYSRTFCNFGRNDWHPSGWGCHVPIPLDTPDFSLPPMTSKHYWHDMDRKYCGLYLAGTGEESYLGGQIYTLNESFLRSAYDVAYAILKFECKEDSYNRTSEQHLRHEEKQKEIALESHSNLNKKFPGTIPNNCKDFLNENK